MTPATMAGECEARQTATSPLHKGLHQAKNNHHAQDRTSRTSLTLTLCDSWDTSDASKSGGVDVPAFLQPFFGVDFLPFSPTIQEEEIHVPPMAVPRSVAIAATEETSPVFLDDNVSSVKSCHRVLSPAPAPEDTQELQELLIQSRSGKKKKAGKRFKAAARAVLQRVKKTPSVGGKKKGSKRVSSKTNDLAVETTPAHLDQQIGTGTTSWISPTATAATEGMSPLSCLTDELQGEGIRKQTQGLRVRAEEQEEHMKTTHSEIEGLQTKLATTISKYQAQLEELQATQEQLAQLASTTGTVKPAVAVEDQSRVFKRSESGTFMRIHDLDLSGSSSESESASLSSLSQSAHNTSKANQELQVPTSEFLLMDHYLLEIVDQLMGVGFDLATDETDRFTPTRDTVKLLSQIPASTNNGQNDWPIEPWTPAWDKNVLVWTGKVSHEGFGHTWPVVKGRAILNTSAQNILEYLWDSSLVPKYNPLSQGRDDLYTLQDDVHMTEKESPYGFAGCAKIVRSLNKHRLLPKAIEMKIMLHARPLEQHKGSYILVSRSVWENETATLDSKLAKTVIRTEMLMGCTIMRAIDDNTCEMTQLTHVHSPGVPEYLARKAAPGQCHGMLKTFQALFP